MSTNHENVWWRRLVPLGAFALASFSAGCEAPIEDEATESDQGAWEAESVSSEVSSTHLWIVDRAIDILGRHPRHAKAKAAHDLLTRPSCRTRWMQGLFDADYLHEYNNGRTDLKAGASTLDIVLSGATFKSHFYDADSQTNSAGERAPTAFTETLVHLDAAKKAVAKDEAKACYELGLSLHYLTDLTQPMHAANYTNLSRPIKLHSHVEELAMEIQAGFVLADWSAAPELALEPFINATARAAKTSWLGLFETIADSYEAHPNRFVCGTLREARSTFFTLQRLDHTTCWASNAAVRTKVGDSLRRAQDLTAQFLAIVGGLDTPPPSGAVRHVRPPK